MRTIRLRLARPPFDAEAYATAYSSPLGVEILALAWAEVHRETALAFWAASQIVARPFPRSRLD